MTIKEDLDRALNNESLTWENQEVSESEKYVAMWAAKWVLNYASEHEYCQFRDKDQIRRTITDDSLKHLANQLLSETK